MVCKTKVFAIWPFTESVFQLLLQKKPGLIGTSYRKADCGTVCEIFVYLFLNRAVNLGMDFLKIRYWTFCPVLDLFQGTKLEQMIYHCKTYGGKNNTQCRKY